MLFLNVILDEYICGFAVSWMSLGLGVRVFGSGSSRFFSGSGLSGPKYLDPIDTYKLPGRFFSGPGRFGSIIKISIKYL